MARVDLNCHCTPEERPTPWKHPGGDAPGAAVNNGVEI